MLTGLSFEDLQKEFELKFRFWGKESFNLTKEASPHWKVLGERLKYKEKELHKLSEKARKIVSGVHNKEELSSEMPREYNEKCLLLILEDWLKWKRGSEYPLTWEGLIDLFKDAGISDIAEKLKKVTAK